MKHARTDYDPIQDPRPEGIGEDEPVFLIRGQDKAAVATIRAWASEARKLGADPATCEHVERWADHVLDWQIENGVKVPDVPTNVLRAP